MKKNALLLLIVPFLATSCTSSGVSYEKFKANIDTIEATEEHPYYRVQGVLDFNNGILDVDVNFDQNPAGDTWVPYARYNEGFYCEYAGDSAAKDERNVTIFGMASRSYWLRAPLRLHKDNFFTYDTTYDAQGNPTVTTNENRTCGYFNLRRLITYWMNEPGAAQPSANKIYYEVHDDGSFAIGGNAVHTYLTIDNYPYYPDPELHPEIFDHDKETGEWIWEENDPRPMYKSVVDAKINIRFEYNKDGWLVREFAKSLDYDFNKASANQFYLESVYTYQFE